MQLIPYKNLKPKILKDVFIAQGARIVGDVEIGSYSSIWFNTVLRGDVAPIKIGSHTNIQDNSIIHTSRFNDGRVDIGDHITIGHGALIHACKIMDHAFIGMRSVIMDKAVVEEYAFVAAGSLITEGKIIKSHELWIGAPAKFVRKLTDQDVAFMIDNADNYVKLAKEYLGLR